MSEISVLCLPLFKMVGDFMVRGKEVQRKEKEIKEEQKREKMMKTENFEFIIGCLKNTRFRTEARMRRNLSPWSQSIKKEKEILSSLLVLYCISEYRRWKSAIEAKDGHEWNNDGLNLYIFK